MPTKHQAVKVYLPPAQVDQLTRAARANGISTAELIRRLLVAEAIITDPAIKHGGDRHKK